MTVAVVAWGAPDPAVTSATVDRERAGNDRSRGAAGVGWERRAGTSVTAWHRPSRGPRAAALRSSTVPTDAARAAHEAAVAAGQDTYVDPESGLVVLTAAALARHGRCCGCGCRHCPYSAAERRRAGRPGS